MIKMDKKLTHTDSKGKATMVDVGHKTEQLRVATARGFIRMQRPTVELVRRNSLKKGDVLKVAEIAGIQAAKQTPSLIPLCHSLALSQVDVAASITNEGIEVITECRCTGRTGVEMEALTAAAVALLTIYDMCKSADKTMVIERVELTGKTKNNVQ